MKKHDIDFQIKQLWHLNNDEYKLCCLYNTKEYALHDGFNVFEIMEISPNHSNREKLGFGAYDITFKCVKSIYNDFKVGLELFIPSSILETSNDWYLLWTPEREFNIGVTVTEGSEKRSVFKLVKALSLQDALDKTFETICDLEID